MQSLLLLKQLISRGKTMAWWALAGEALGVLGAKSEGKKNRREQGNALAFERELYPRQMGNVCFC